MEDSQDFSLCSNKRSVAWLFHCLQRAAMPLKNLSRVMNIQIGYNLQCCSLKVRIGRKRIWIFEHWGIGEHDLHWLHWRLQLKNLKVRIGWKKLNTQTVILLLLGTRKKTLGSEAIIKFENNYNIL